MPTAAVLARFALSTVVLVVAAGELLASDFNPFIYFRF